MPLGGSVTYGSESSDGNGYRDVLQSLLIASGYHVEMAGSRNAGSMKDNCHEGWRGYRIDQISSKAQRSVSRFLPNLFTVNAGSNDCVQDFRIEEAGDRMSNLIESLWEASPGSTVLLSTLLMNRDTNIEKRVLEVNTQFRDLAIKRQNKGQKILLVDMHSPDDGPELEDLADGTHPNDIGYAKMACLWYNGVSEACRRDYLAYPHSLPPMSHQREA